MGAASGQAHLYGRDCGGHSHMAAALMRRILPCSVLDAFMHFSLNSPHEALKCRTHPGGNCSQER